MINKSRIKTIYVFLSLILSLGVVAALSIPFYSHLLVVAWILSILFLLRSSQPDFGPTGLSRLNLKKSAFVLVFVLLPLIVRVANYNPDRIHGDDLLTAYFSVSYRPRTTNFFTGVPDNSQWVSKFPPPYFIFQKIFLKVAGENTLAVKLSVLPYVLVVSVMVYLITKAVTDKFTGIVALWLYAFLAISIYHETLGLHFISSTAIFLVFFHFLIKAFRSNSQADYLLSGVTCGLCYLSYTSSYIALPFLILVLLIKLITSRKSDFVRHAAWSLVAFLVTVAPFVTYAIKTENYFTQRINQVSLTTGEWSGYKSQASTFAGARQVITDNLILSLQSFVKDGIGGHGGYTFNQLAFFNRTGLFLFLGGLISTLILGWRKPEVIFMVLVVLISYITGIVLTIPPPAYHRLSLAFPFIAIISALPFYLLKRAVNRKIALIITLFAALVFAITNQLYFMKVVSNETIHEDIKLAKLINTHYPKRHVHVAAFTSFAFEKIYYFLDGKTALSIDTDYPTNYLERFNQNEKYIYVILYPNDIMGLFAARDPAGKVIPFSDKYGLFIN